MTLRIIFMGSPEYSVPTLSALANAGHEIVAVYCQPPRRAGRGMGEQKSAVNNRAAALGIRVFTPTNFREETDIKQFVAHQADIVVVVAYGLILPQVILDAPRLECLNGHASLLPRWRGAAPMQRAIEAGDTETGVMIMRMEKSLDTGPVMMTEKTSITAKMSTGELHDLLADMTAKLMVKAVQELETGKAEFTPQSPDGVTYAKKIAKSETRINWNRPAKDVHNHISAMSPFPGAWCEMELGKNPVRVKILRSEQVAGSGTLGTVLDDNLAIACADGAVRLLTLQKAGKQACKAQEFLRGNPIKLGVVLR